MAKVEVEVGTRIEHEILALSSRSKERVVL